MIATSLEIFVDKQQSKSSKTLNQLMILVDSTGPEKLDSTVTEGSGL